MISKETTCGSLKGISPFKTEMNPIMRIAMTFLVSPTGRAIRDCWMLIGLSDYVGLRLFRAASIGHSTERQSHCCAAYVVV